MTNCTVNDNKAFDDADEGGHGGGIYNSGELTMTNCTVNDNWADTDGGGIFYEGVATFSNHTVSGNDAFGGGGVWNDGELVLRSTTISFNMGSSGGGGGVANIGTMEVQNSLIANNFITIPGTGPDCFSTGTINSLGHNLIGDPSDCDIALLPTDLTGAPDLGEFADDGTPGNGHFPLLLTSLAIDAGNDEACSETDQIGNPRPVDGDGDGVLNCDIGAIEFQAPIMLTPIADATIKRSSPTTNFGAVSEVEVDARSRKDFLMTFDVSGIEDRSVVSAKLRLFCSNGSDQGGEFHRVASDWLEDSVTWDNAPPADPNVIVSLGPVVRNTWVEVDVTPQITGDGLHSLRVMSSSANGADYRSKEKEERAPQLVITVEERVEDTLTILPTNDATVKLDFPAENFGAVREVEVDARSRKDFLMTFDVSGIGTRTVVNAKLRLFCTDGSNQGGDFHEIDTDWSEDSVTWDNAPPANPDVLASLGPVVRNTWVEVDLSSLITGDGIYSLRVDSTSANGADYRSREKSGLEPELIITLE